MPTLELTKTTLRMGVWSGIISGAGKTTPSIKVTHHDKPIDGVALSEHAEEGTWILNVPIPSDAISDGVQTLLILNADKDEKIGHITLLAGDVMADDVRAEMDLLRAELDMLKRAFRRHCTETQ